MKRNLKFAFRYLWRNKTGALLNIAGLSLGITSVLLLFLFIRQELSFDNFHDKKDRLYRIVRYIDRNGDEDVDSGTPLVLGKRLRSGFPQAEKTALTFYDGGGTFIVDPDKPAGAPKKIKLHEGIVYADPEFYEMFDFPWLIGDYKKVLSEPNSAAISESMAEKFFGVKNGDYSSIIGRTLKLKNSVLLTVNGIIKDHPANTDFPFDVVISSITHYNIGEKEDYETWMHVNSSTNYYVLLREGVSKNEFESRLSEMAEKVLPQIPNIKTGFKLQPLSDLHYNAKLRNYNFRVINKNVLFALGLIAALVIIAACINFINLSTAQAVKRSKEAGIKKTLGAGGFSLFSYFMTEVAVIVFSSAILSIVIAELLTPYLSQALELKIEFNPYTDYQSLGFLLALSAVVIFIAGFYPSFLMSKSAPIASLKGGLTGGGNKSGLLLRRSLVVAQFVISQALIIGALVIGKQMEFFKNKDLGYDKDLIIITDLPEEGYKQKDYFIERLNTLSNVKSVSAALNPPSGVSSNWGTVVNPENNPDMPIRADMKPADINYVRTYNLKLLAGRDIRETDGFNRVVINESMMKKIGINNPSEALGFRLLYDDSLALEIVGVLKNFYLRSLLREKIEPMILFNAENSDLAEFYANVGIKLKHYGSKEEMENTIKGIRLAYESAYPAEVFEYEFLDQALYKYYSDEERMSNIIRFFMAISVLIGSIGLYGLISFIAAQKTKEIGIRKVLGASVTGIVGLLSKEFIVLLGVSFVISWPAAYYLINKWLEDYPQRIDVGFGIFAAAAGIALVISAATISYQAVKAATANPVKSLKYE